MKKLFLFSALTFSLSALAQGFSGSIEFKYYTLKDTNSNTYFVKDKLVRLDQYNKKTGNIEGSFLFDLAGNTIRFLNPKRKVWGFNKSEMPPIVKGTCAVTKGGNKRLQGINCTEYVVKNTEENTAITYWIATDKFTFFSPMMKLWNRKDKQSIYFNKIEGLAEGAMPLMSEEKQLSDGKTISKLEVVKIGKGAPDDALLEIPAGYNKFDQ